MSNGTIIVAILVVAAIVGAAFVLIRDRRSGKCSCGSNCGCCSGCNKPIEPKQ